MKQIFNACKFFFKSIVYMRYPDYVKQFNPKGTIVKRVNGTYYAFYATSKRVPDKKYPVQIIKGLAGRIDESGFHKLSKAFVETEHVVRHTTWGRCKNCKA